MQLSRQGTLEVVGVERRKREIVIRAIHQVRHGVGANLPEHDVVRIIPGGGAVIKVVAAEVGLGILRP